MDPDTDKSDADKGSVNEKSMQNNGEECKEKLKELKMEKNEPSSVQPTSKKQEKECSG